MKHKVKISVSDTPQAGGIITCRNVGIRERILRFLLGDKRKITVLVPGESVGEIAICEAEKGEDVNGQGKCLTNDKRNNFREALQILSQNCHTPCPPTAN